MGRAVHMLVCLVLQSSGGYHAFTGSDASFWTIDMCMHAGRERRAAVVVRAEEKATLDLNEGVEGGTDYSGILAGACHACKYHACKCLCTNWIGWTALDDLLCGSGIHSFYDRGHREDMTCPPEASNCQY